MDDKDRPNNREVENEMVRPSDKDGKPPKPATEPKHASDEDKG
ncbi:hypothetical protein [Novosphingobium terrae]|nr:hypothetical protein [Novosphingobium terrae]